MNVLIIGSTRIGDAVLSSGAVDWVLTRHPEARLTIACGPAAAPLFGAVPNLCRVIPLEKRPFALHWLRLWLVCAATVWDLVIDLRHSAVAYLLIARRRRVRKRRTGDHRVRQLARTLGVDKPPHPRIWTTAAQDAEAARLLPDGPPVLAIAPTANWPGKIWPAERFVALAERLTGAGCILGGGRIAVFGASEERPLAKPVIDGLPESYRVDLVGRIDLPTAYACLKRCALFVGNDSALMHLAAVGGVPTIGLFGPSRPEHYAPWGRVTATVRTEASYEALVAGADYDHRTTGSLMHSLSVDKVVAAAETLWRHRDREGRIVKPTLSALVVARNEEAQLADCLRALRFADEVVVVLDRSSDGSVAIAHTLADKVIEGAWELEGERRNTGIDACSGDWILEVDADERVTSALAEEIRDILPGASAGYFLVPFDNYVGERLVRHGWGGSWGVSATVRLFSRGAKRWGPQRVHPEVTLSGERRSLKRTMVHYVDGGIGDMIRRLDRYTAQRARDLREQGLPETFGRNLRRLFTRFYKCYVRRRGYREGYYGFLIALFAGLYPILSWLRARLEEN